MDVIKQNVLIIIFATPGNKMVKQNGTNLAKAS